MSIWNDSEHQQHLNQNCTDTCVWTYMYAYIYRCVYIYIYMLPPCDHSFCCHCHVDRHRHRHRHRYRHRQLPVMAIYPATLLPCHLSPLTATRITTTILIILTVIVLSILSWFQWGSSSRRQMNIAGVACGGPTIRSVDFEGFRLARGEKDQVHVCSRVHTSTHTHVDAHMSRNG